MHTMFLKFKTALFFMYLLTGITVLNKIILLKAVYL